MAEPIDPGVDIGHVHLKVADVDRSLDFYCGILGFELMQRWGADAAFISAEEWPMAPDGEGVQMGTMPLDVDDLISELRDG